MNENALCKNIKMTKLRNYVEMKKDSSDELECSLSILWLNDVLEGCCDAFGRFQRRIRRGQNSTRRESKSMRLTLTDPTWSPWKYAFARSSGEIFSNTVGPPQGPKLSLERRRFNRDYIKIERNLRRGTAGAFQSLDLKRWNGPTLLSGGSRTEDTERGRKVDSSRILLSRSVTNGNSGLCIRGRVSKFVHLELRYRGILAAFLDHRAANSPTRNSQPVAKWSSGN